MTPQEQQLITQLFQRLRQAPVQEKDPEAEALIAQGVREQPDAPYLLVQTVLIQDMALTNAQARIAELGRELAAKSAQAPRRSTSFLGGLLHGSVPSAGEAPRGPESTPQPQTGWAPSPSPMQPMMTPGGGSSFLRAAAATALGVAGGELLFQGIRSMFGGPMGFGGLAMGTPMQPSLSETVINNYYDTPEHPGSGGDHRMEAADYHPDEVGHRSVDQSGHDDGSRGVADANQDYTDQDVAGDFDSGGGFGGDDSGLV